MVLGRNIRYLRKKNDWSQEHLADLIEYKNYTSIQKWETGVSEPRFATVQKLAKIFDVSIDDLTKCDLERGEQLPTYYSEKPKSIGHDMLFSAADGATEEELIQTANYLNFLKGTRKG